MKRSMSGKMKVFSVTMPPDLAHKARVVAARQNKSRSAFITEAVQEAIQRFNEEDSKEFCQLCGERMPGLRRISVDSKLYRACELCAEDFAS